MLVLSRKPGESVSIGGDVVVTVIEVSKGKIRLGVEAPKTVQISRDDIKTKHEKGSESP